MINQKGALVLDTEKNGNVYQLVLPLGVPFADCFDALFDFVAGVKELEKLDKARRDAIEAQQAALEAEQQPAQEVAEPVAE